jgi:hypothetical protein
MPLSNVLIVTTAVGFGLSISAAPAFAANSQPRKVYPSNTISVKGGASTKHKTSAGGLAEGATRSADGKVAPVAPGRFAAGAEDSQTLGQNH